MQVTVDGKQYPAVLTMGAQLDFKDMTGKEVTEIGSALTDLCKLIWCALKAGARRSGGSFDMSLDEFADLVDMSEIGELSRILFESAGGKGTSSGKKKASRL